jgi:hypothetical protein
MGEHTLTLAEAAEATGLTPKALQRRIDRGSLRSVLVDSRRRVPLSELLLSGLLTPDGSAPPDVVGEAWVKEGHSPAGSDPPGSLPTYTMTARELLDRIERQAQEIGEMRALTREAESLRAQVEAEHRARESLEQEFHRERAELAAARARIAELEATTTVSAQAAAPAARRWWAPWRRPSEASPASS